MAQRRRRKIVSVKRADAAEVRDGQLLDLKEPQFLSIVKAPANRTPFKIVRDDAGGRRRRRTSDTPALLTVRLPADMEMAQAEEVFQRFGLSADDYDIVEGDGGIEYRRKNLAGDEKTVPINLGNGVVALIEATSLTRGIPEQPDHPGITALRFDFPDKEFGENWLKERGIDSEIGKWLELSESVVFMRHDVMPPEGSKEIEIDGATVTLAQTQDSDIPTRIYRSVIEEAYGSWGWGMIDFNQAMADAIFTRDVSEANRMLWDILDNILFYSYLPLADRQALVMNALNQFAVWLANLMSALPRAMTEPNVTVDLNSQGTRDDNAAPSENSPSEETKETADMGKKPDEQKAQGTENQETVERQDPDASEKETTVTETEETTQRAEVTEEVAEDTEKVFTRSEAEEIAAAAVTAYQDKQEQAKREDASPAGIAAAVAAAIGEALAPVVQRVDGLAGKVDALSSATVVREDDPDNTSDKETDEEIARHDPYRGAIFRRAR